MVQVLLGLKIIPESNNINRMQTEFLLDKQRVVLMMVVEGDLAPESVPQRHFHT
jgi:hypothetical protein